MEQKSFLTNIGSKTKGRKRKLIYIELLYILLNWLHNYWLLNNLSSVDNGVQGYNAAWICR
jgi:hypothetical protein